MFKEFRDFAMRGNVLDLAIGVIIGAAFGNIVNSAVSDVIMPPIGMVVGNVDFASLFISLDGRSFESLAKAKEAGAPVIAYGQFLNTILNFLIIAFVVFLIVKQVNRWMPPPPAPAAATKDCPYCANAVPLKAVRCGFCTSELRPA
jgi:large conductance mechanosensitive channel